MASLSADGVKPVLGSDRFRRQEQHCLSYPVSHITKSYESWYNAKDIFRQDMHGLVHRIYHLHRDHNAFRPPKALYCSGKPCTSFCKTPLPYG